MYVPILMYHGIAAPGTKARGTARWDDRYAISIEVLATQVQYLASQGIAAPALDELLGGRLEGARRAAVLTFDDGYDSDVTAVLPILQTHGFTATFFVETGAVDGPGRLSRHDLLALAQAGMTIGSHTVTHRFLSDLPSNIVRQELLDSKKFLEDAAGVCVRFLSLPGGRFDGRTAAIARDCGFDAVCTSMPGGTDPHKPGFLLRRLCIRRETSLGDFRRLVRLDPLRLAQEHLRYFSRRSMKLLLGRARHAELREALRWIAASKG